ncbi:MAG: POT family proton-dependent oligopeptide transporter [Rubritalea sp.]|jgi:POT family proton-dependent oligopeptide transporter
MYKDTPSDSKTLPKGIPYIIGNEAAERFSFYGMKAALVVFMTQYLHLMGDTVTDTMSDAKASEYMHLFVFAVYLTPIAGAIISDRFWGKYKTIISLSIVYCLGHAALAFMGVTGSAAMWLLAGLGLISVGAGGIKPCVSAHVGDQFGENNKHMLPNIFNWFYFSINLGAAISNMMIPWLLEWFGPHWAFGVPGVLMAIATFLFWLGRREFIHVPAAGKSFTKEVFAPAGIKLLLKLIGIFAFVAIFWSLFDQTASTWVLQAQDMNLNILGFNLLPSQIQTANPFFILLLIPLFTMVIYPTVEKIVPLTPLRKIGAGLFLTVIAFSISAFIQEWIDAGEKPHVIWQILAYLLLTSAEIMVSIVCLEFAYTQSPKSMKSMVMALFLLSVAAGNLFTSAVNSYIQVENPLEKEVSEALVELRSSSPKVSSHHADWNIKAYAGFDKKPNTADDITIHYNNKAVIKKRDVPAEDSLLAAAEVIQKYALEIGRKFPLTEDGQQQINQIKDPWQRTLTYRVINSTSCRITSSGPDKTLLSPWDNSLTIELKDNDPKEKSDKKTWIEKRKALLEVADENDHVYYENKDFKHSYTVGGLYKLEGANYFWFFTGLMLVTSFIFIPFAVLYKNNTEQ